MTQETYDSYPDQMTVREFKIKGEVYVTTFQDHKKYNKVALANHYKQRWHIEINFNSLKTIMSMDHLRSKTPDMVHKERKRRYLGRYFAHPMMQNRRAKRDDYKPSAVRVTQRYVP
ncbi:Transposase DDE domain protein [Piscirickettsia salmonis]|uniref:Transposase n=2 Tax=Piscirickettsia salmonis TaxID=1238 RepID=A0AAC8ZNP9_PISSA|nr:transposase [Piscirickettsia salmonis]QGN99142.1 Transposase DDE domain protein [Piscirickettsia salmonis]QGO13439.1 Transposase DDE domain protein [Piscirickettsia salmonis]QGO70651.1 Transposase DDE domain protein [Piscirickettsia salmonis]QGO84543.1 Transposase DDE domain protein [Piscirickettsia salmonis]